MDEEYLGKQMDDVFDNDIEDSCINDTERIERKSCSQSFGTDNDESKENIECLQVLHCFVV